MNSPFLTTTVYDACTKARVYYLNTLARMQANGGQPVDWMERLQEQSRNNLELFHQAALQAAFNGESSTASNQLAVLVAEWGVYQALSDLINANGMYVDPADPDTANDIDRAIEHQVRLLVTELQNSAFDGEQQRKTNQADIYAERQTQLFGEYQKMAREQSTLWSQVHQSQQQVIQGQQTGLSQAHHINEQYANTALQGVQQAQQGVQWMVQEAARVNQQASQQVYQYQQGVEKMYAHGADVMNAALATQEMFNENMMQNLPREMEKAQEEIQKKSERRKWMNRGYCALILLALPFVLYGIAWLLIRMVLHF